MSQPDEPMLPDVLTERLAGADLAMTTIHKPYTDDGVTYCGWATGVGVVDGCGHLWPCPTERGPGSTLPAERASPRTWAQLEIPEDVQAVSDRDGVTWRRRYPNPQLWSNGAAGTWLTHELIRMRGPLTEVINDGD